MVGGICFENLPGGFQAVEQRHGDVHQHHFGAEFFGQRDRLAAVLRFADDFKIVFEFEHLAETLAHDHVIFGEQDGDSFHGHLNVVVAGFFQRNIAGMD